MNPRISKLSSHLQIGMVTSITLTFLLAVTSPCETSRKLITYYSILINFFQACISWKWHYVTWLGIKCIRVTP